MELNEEQKRAVRTAARERKRRQRERDQQKRVRALEAQRAAVERAERRRRSLHFYGESTPGRNANTFEDELAIHREFLRALREPDVRDGESLRSVAQRTYEAWINGQFASRDGRTIYVPGFNRAAQQIDADYGFVIDNRTFDEVWDPPKDCSGDELVDTDGLPKLPKLPKPPAREEPAPEPEAPQPPTEAPVIPLPQPTVVNFSWTIPPSAHAYLSGRGTG